LLTLLELDRCFYASTASLPLEVAATIDALAPSGLAGLSALVLSPGCALHGRDRRRLLETIEVIEQKVVVREVLVKVADQALVFVDPNTDRFLGTRSLLAIAHVPIKVLLD
jgi:hypothetical protein